MTRTSKALRRLGVAGLVAATIGAGIPALIGSAAQAAGPATSVTFTNPSSGNKTGAAGTCLNYSMNASNSSGNVAGATITVSVTTATPTADIDFCTAPQTGFGDGTNVNNPAPQSPTILANGGPATTTTASTDVARFTTDANGNFTFGIIQNVPGTATITTFVDTNGNGTFDFGEVAGQSGTATYRNGGPPGNAAQNAVSALTVAPNPDAAVVGEARTYTVTAVNNQGDTLAGVVVSYQTSPLGTSADNLGPTNCTGTTDNNGQVKCSVTFTKTPSTTVRFFANQSAAGSGPGWDSGEPFKDVPVSVQPAPTQGAQTLNASCQPLSPATGTVGLASTSPCVNEVQDPSRTIRFLVNNSSSTNNTGTGTTLLAFTVSGSSTASLDKTECSTVPGGGSGSNAATSSFCDVTVTETNPVAGEVLTVRGTIRGTTTTASATVTFRNQPADARNIALAPKTATTAPGAARTFSATVTDGDGKPVPGVFVSFTESGPGSFRNGASSVGAVTDANGVASADVTSLSNETGDQTITASIADEGNQCAQLANKGTDPRGAAYNTTTNTVKAGNCTDTATNTWGTSPSPTTSPGARTKLTLSTSTPDIQPNQQGILVATGTPGQNVTLRCYSRPSVTYFDARPDISNSNGTVEFRILPGTNTRCFVKYVGTADNDTNASPSVVINVHTTLSLSTVRTGVRQYIFQGRNLPRRAGQLITLYRITSSGQEIRTSNLKTDASGIYRVTRTFTGNGTFRFRVRTSQTLTNAPGASNIITVTIH